MPFWEYRYYVDVKHPPTGERRRVIITPASPDALPAAGTWPAWKEAPAPLAAWRQVQPGAVIFDNPSDAGYPDDGVPVGLPETSTMKVEVRYDIASQTTEFLDALISYSSSVIINGAHGSTHDMTALAVWTVLSDNGNAALAVEDFETVFQGCQRILPQREGTIVPRRRASTTIELVEIGRAVLDAITMKAVCTETLGAVPSGMSVVGPKGRAYDLVYQDSGGDIVAVTNWELEGSAVFYRLEDLFVSMEFLSDALYEAMLRGTFDAEPGNFTFTKSVTNLSFAHPYSHIDFYGQGYDQTLTQGDAVAIGSVYFIGIIVLNTGNMDTPADRVAGLLVEQKDDTDTLATDVNLYETLKTICSATFCKAIFYQRARAGVSILFSGVLEAPAAATDLALADIVYNEHDEEAGLSYVESANVLANASVSWKSNGDADNTEVKFIAFGTQSEKGATAELALHNLPTVGGGASDYYGANSGVNEPNFPTDFDDLAGAVRNYRRIIFNWWGLYYFDNPLGIASQVPIRIHHNCTINHGASQVTPTPIFQAVELPSYAFSGSELYDAIIAAFYVIQNEGGLANGVTRAYTTLFGNGRQTKYPLRVRTGTASYNQIGGIFNLMPLDAGGNHSAWALSLNTASPMTHCYGVCIALKVTPYVDYKDTESAPVRNCTEIVLLGVKY